MASSEMDGKKIITTPGHTTANGVHLIIHPGFKIIDFFEINSPEKGYGEKMVKAAIDSLPDGWGAVVTMDYSGGFWSKMKEKYNKIEIM